MLLSPAEVCEITTPVKLWSRAEVLTSPSPVPRAAGVYGWYFRDIPGAIDTSSCVQHDGRTLLYVGISPKEPPRNGALPSTQTLRSRVTYHYRGNAEGSTLRLTLGCLLADQLGIELRRVGSGTRLTFSSGELVLSAWMARNAYVCWTECTEPWVLEQQFLRTVSLPLNLDQNRQHAFHAELTQLRRRSKQRARSLPVVPR
jgi:hypothetical protein